MRLSQSIACSATVDCACGCRRIGGNGLPRRVVIEVLVDALAEAARFKQRCLELDGPVERAHAFEACLDLLEEGIIFCGQLPGLGHAALEALPGKTERAIHQVAPVCHQFIVDPVHEILPGKLNVGGLGGEGRQDIAHGVGLEILKDGIEADDIAATCAELLRAEVQVLVGRNIPGEVQMACARVVANQHPRPDDRVEYDVVLANEVVDRAPQG